jgi:anthranilate synthase component 1
MYNFSKEDWIDSYANKDSSLVYKKISSDVLTPILAFLKLKKYFKDHIFLFESADNDQKKGRFSIIGFMPDAVWKCKDHDSFINNNFENNSDDFIIQKGNPLKNLRNFITESKIDFSKFNYYGKELPAMTAGIFGYMGYDMVRLMEDLPNNNLNDNLLIPDSIFIRPQILLIFDNFYDCLLICAPSYKKHEDYDQLLKKIAEVEKLINEPLIQEKPVLNNDFKGFNFTANYSKEQYCKMVEKSIEYITSGDIFQVLPSQRFVSEFPEIDEFEFYRCLRRVNPSPFLFYLQFNDFILTGSSPEIMTSKQGKKITVRPLAGTRKRGKNIPEDKILADELLSDEKEIAEHLMLIDLARNDLGVVAKSGSVEVTKKMVIENYSHVMHISSNVEAIIDNKFDALDLLISCFPAGTVSGAPKIRAMEIIEEIEKVKRSFYAGCVGYFASNGDMETCITLRSALIKDHKIYLHSGAGVVFDSNPDFEYQETLNKAQALIKACESLADQLLQK